MTEYELIDIDIELSYQFEDDTCGFAREDINSTDIPSDIKRDDNGIPMGQTMDEIKERESIIKDFLKQWTNDNPERKIYNEALDAFIWVKGISVIEAKEHSSKSYRSTQAVMMISEILAKALPVRRVPTKKGNKNQSQFAYMLVMVYRHEELGTIKLTVGVKSNEQNIEYGISALQPDQPIIDDSKISSKNKKRRSQ
ncbi:MAG: hypothetical protein MJZ12_01985 [Prevotella sp.]|nr:hypothetical protein [Prevotella sp.]